MKRRLIVELLRKKIFKFHSMNRVSKSYVSLFLALMLLITSTAAWFSINYTASLQSRTMSLESASGMRVNKGMQITNNIRIDEFTLDEASSVDGRNIFFPESDSFSTNTEDMIFREGNAGDRNQKYGYTDFQLSGDSAKTDVYIRGYTIKVGDDVYCDTIQFAEVNGKTVQLVPGDCPIRIAFITDSSQTPAVIDPSARVQDYVGAESNVNAVESIDVGGHPTLKAQNNYSFTSFYYYVGKPLFTIEGQHKLKGSMIVWLEGAAANCEAYLGKKISIEVYVESNWSNMETITFVDATLPDDGGDSNKYWISSSEDAAVIALTYEVPASRVGDVASNKTVVMSRVSELNDQGEWIKTRKWVAKIPEEIVTNISFYRLSKVNSSDGTQLNKGTIFNSWHTNSNVMTDLVAANTKQKGSCYFIKNVVDGVSGYPALQTSRELTKNGETYRSTVYYATRGNGYGEVKPSELIPNGGTIQDGINNAYEKWLSPCIGYWDWDGNYGGGKTQDEEEKEEEIIESETIKVGISLSTGKKPWIETNCNNGSTMWVHFSSGVDYQLPHHSANKFEVTDSNENAPEVSKGTTVQYFFLKHPSGDPTKLYVNPPCMLTRKANYNFEVNNDDTVSYH